jgi:hypothetical protein
MSLTLRNDSFYLFLFLIQKLSQLISFREGCLERLVLFNQSFVPLLDLQNQLLYVRICHFDFVCLLFIVALQTLNLAFQQSNRVQFRGSLLIETFDLAAKYG